MGLIDDAAGVLLKPVACVGVVALVFFAGYAWRWHGDDARELARSAQEQLLSAEDARLHTKAAQFAAKQTDKTVTLTRVVFQQVNTELKEIVTHEVLRNVCLDDDGIRLWNDAGQGVRHGSVQPARVDAARVEDTPAAP